MGDRNQLLFLERHTATLAGPYLETGSHDYGSTENIRAIFSGRGDYLGVDMIEGPGVDLVADLSRPFAEVDEALDGRRFGTIFTLSVLEHCENPFAMAENLTSLLRPGGAIAISVPFAWQFHGYPSDYWRFTHEGVKKLFPRLEFDLEKEGVASVSGRDFEPLDPTLGKLSFSFSAHRKKGRPGRGISAKLLKIISSLGPYRWLVRERYVLAPTMVTMIGRLPAETAT